MLVSTSSVGQKAGTGGYRALAWTLICDALGDYHAYHRADLRRCLVMTAIRNSQRTDRKKHIASVVRNLRSKASIAEQWFDGCSARYPFWLAAGWLGWEAEDLRYRLKDQRTGWNLLVQMATTATNRLQPESERVAKYLASKK